MLRVLDDGQDSTLYTLREEGKEMFLCVLCKQLTYQAFNIEAKVTALEVRVCSIPVEHDLSDTLVYQLVVLRPAGRREETDLQSDGQRERNRGKIM